MDIFYFYIVCYDYVIFSFRLNLELWDYLNFLREIRKIKTDVDNSEKIYETYKMLQMKKL